MTEVTRPQPLASTAAAMRPSWSADVAPGSGAAFNHPMPGGVGEVVLEVSDLAVQFRTEEGLVQAVRGVDIEVRAGETLGIVGESGSGKSVTMLAVMGLLPRTAKISGSIRLRGAEIMGMSAKEARSIRGSRIAMIFQDPLTALNPCHRVGDQIAEMVQAHHPQFSDRVVAGRAAELLELVGIPQPGLRARQYPHEFSGGMRQRAMIAMAIANDPDVLIADEPTTALDVTIQAQILEVMRTVQEQIGTAIVFITHDLGVIARMASRVHVMYAGRGVEMGSVLEIFANPLHPYTRGLLSSLPRPGLHTERLVPIAGTPPSMLHPPAGCAFHPRCPMARDACTTGDPPALVAVQDARFSACLFADELIADTWAQR